MYTAQGNPVFDDLTTFHLSRAEARRWEPHSYDRPRVFEPDFAKLRIGKFCSIGL